MPKETVANDGPYSTKVGWSNTDGGGYIQLGVEVSDGEDLFNRLLSPYSSEIGKLATFLVEDPSLKYKADFDTIVGGCLIQGISEIESYKGIWATLNREDCNRLIKVLRRARDASFGRDE